MSVSDPTDPTEILEFQLDVSTNINYACLVMQYEEPRFAMTRQIGTRPAGMAGTRTADTWARTRLQSAATDGMPAAYRLAGVI